MGRMLAELRYRVTERIGDPWYGVSTRGVVAVTGFAPNRPDLRDSMPIGYEAVTAALRELPVRREESRFLDYGCGKGRACVVAASLGFRSVTGLELSEELAAVARGNLARMRWRRTRECTIVTGDAGEHVVPDDIAVIYFFNPFVGDVLRATIDQIRASLARAPRAIHIVFFNNGAFEEFVSGSAWIRRRAQYSVYPRVSCGVYVTI